MPTFAVEYEANTCPHEKCGVTFALPSAYVQRRREDGRAFYCPSGHTMSFNQTELDRARDREAKLQRERDAALSRAHDAERRALLLSKRLKKAEKAKANAGG